MTAFDRFDPFERRIAEAIDEIAAARLPDYLDDVFQRTERTSQRPRWTFLERWLPVDTTLSPGLRIGRVPVRALVLLMLLLAIVGGVLLVYVGSSRRVPPPFGPARNGSLAYLAKGDIYVRDGITGDARILIGGDGDQFAPDYSPDGTQLSFITTRSDGDHFATANADGTAIREIALIPPTGNAQAQWSPDSASMGLIYDVDGTPQLSIVPVRGGPTKVIDLGGLRPLDLAWQPPAGQRILVRVQAERDDSVTLYTINPDGSDLRALAPWRDSGFGAKYTMSGPVWSPDGKRIAYNSVEVDPGASASHFRVHVMNADGTNDVPVVGPTDPLIQQAWPHFSPDGRSILINQWRFKGDDPSAEGWLGIMPADLSAPARDIGHKFRGGEDTGLPSYWSPDGTHVITRVNNVSQVWSVDPITGEDQILDWAGDLPGWQRQAP
jgi:dipeptidyl aminopeptidase/acylaminoacyl peptidase